MFSPETKRTELSSLGEFGLIRHLTQNFPLIHSSSLVGVGDDAAVIDPQNYLQVITTDLLLEGIHFDLSYCPLKHLGYKAVAVNLSDVFAMNGIPRQITVSLGVSARFSLEHLEELYAGIRLACQRYRVDLVGGDTSSSLTGLTISITAIGTVTPDRLTRRNTAQPNDLICVSGDLGSAYLGLQLLKREMAVFDGSPDFKPHFEGYDYLLERQLKPEPRGDLIAWMHENQVLPSAMIDVSDGLSSELLHICSQSNVGCQIYEEKIPIAQECRQLSIEMEIGSTLAALNGGEDYELLFTIPLSQFELIQKCPYVSIIGHITPADQGSNLILKAGGIAPLIAQGWNAYSPTE